MERKLVTIGWSLTLVGATGLMNGGCRRAMAAEPRIPNAPSEVSLTVYKDDFGMVAEQRPVELREGSNQVRLTGVSSQLDPDSVIFKAPEGANVVATTYDLGSDSGQNLLKRLAGREVELIWNSTNGQEGERIRGILEPGTDGGFLLRSGDRVYINPAGTLVAPADSGIATLPGLSVQLKSEKGGSQDLRMSYLTRGLSWSSDYVAHLDTDNARLDIECWASVTNRTGVPFRDAQIAFVAGTPNRAVRAQEQQERFEGKAYAAEADASVAKRAVSGRMTPEAVGELYAYKPEDRATIGVDQISRVRMFDATSVPVRLDYSVRLPDIYAWQPRNSSRLNAQLAVELDNRSSSGLGMPMPSGGVRIFQRDGNEDRYTGADTIRDTPVDGHISMTLTKVFDITAEPTVLSTSRVDKRTTRRAMRVLLRNAKDRDVEVRLVQSFYGTWKVSSGQTAEKLDGSTAQWKVRVPARGTTTLETTVDSSY